MSEFNIKFGTSRVADSRVVQRDSGTNITLKSSIPASSIQRLTDIDMNGLEDGSVLVFEASTNSFQLKQFLNVSSNGEVVFDARSDF